MEYISQRDLFVKQDEAYIAKGYQPVLVMNEGYADVSYLETEELVEYRRLEAIKNRIQLINMPQALKKLQVRTWILRILIVKKFMMLLLLLLSILMNSQKVFIYMAISGLEKVI